MPNMLHFYYDLSIYFFEDANFSDFISLIHFFFLNLYLLLFVNYHGI